MTEQRVIESINYIMNYDYSNIMEDFPILMSRPCMPQHGAPFICVKVEHKHDTCATKIWEERLDYRYFGRYPIKLNKYSYAHLYGYCINRGQYWVDSILSITVILETDTIPFVNIRYFKITEDDITDKWENKKYEIAEYISREADIKVSVSRRTLLGAIVGDIVGSPYEGRRWNVKTTDFPLFSRYSRFTDDSVMTLAVAKWLVEDVSHSHEHLITCMRLLGNEYPWAGYGGAFKRWLTSSNPLPYNGWGNGSAMRVSPVGMYSKTLEEALELAKISAEVTHNHPESIKGAQAIAISVFIAKHSKNVWSKDTKDEIRHYISSKFGYNLDRTIESIRPYYHFDVSCPGSVPEAIIAYLDGKDFEDTLRLAVSLGGDSDTIASMAGAIAGAKGDIPKEISKKSYSLLPYDLKSILNEFEMKCGSLDE